MRLLPKLVLLMTVVAAVPLALAGWSAVSISKRVAREQIGDAHQRLAENLAESVKSFDADEISALATAARAFDFERLSPEEQRGALKLLFFQMPSADLLALVDTAGHDVVDPVALAPDEQAPEALKSRATRDDAQVAAFRSVLDVKDAVAEGYSASPLYDLTGKRGPHQAIAVAVGRGRLLAADVSFEKVRADLETFHIGSHGEAYLVDEAGKILVHKDRARVGEDLGKTPFISQRLATVGNESAAGELDAHGEHWLAAFAPVGVAGMGLVVAQPAADALRASTSLGGQTLVWVVTALLFAVVLAVFYAGEVSRPVLSVAGGARTLAKGDLSARIDVTSKDEIGELAKAFNEMATRLQASMDEIARQNDEIRAWNATLTQKVDERTRELREAQAELVQSKKLAALAELGAGLAHELNNPLAAIKGFAQLMLLSRKLEEKDMKSMKTIEEQARRCSEIVTKLLRYSQQASSDARERLDMNTAMDEALEVVAQRLKDEKVEVERAYGFGLPAVLANPGEMREVFWHLLSNARNAMAGKGGGKLTVSSWREVAGEDDRVKICFKDTGRGIAPDILDRIFEPFFTTKSEWRGTGLGLAVVHRIVTDHGGTIAVESKLGEGAAFTLTFPAAKAGAVEAPSTTPAAAVRAKTQLV